MKVTAHKLILGLTIAVQMITASATAAPLKFAAGRILVQPKAGVSATKFNSTLKAVGAKADQKIGKTSLVSVLAGKEEKIALALSHHPLIEFAEVDKKMPPSEFVPNDPKTSWHLATVQAPLAWDTANGTGVVIAVLDSGVDAAHPDLQNKLIPGYNSVSLNSDTSPVYGHGTWVAGTIATETNNGIGIASIAHGGTIMPIRVTNDPAGWAYWSDMARGLTWAADHGADIANMSYGVTGSSTVESAAAYFRSKGGLVFASAGNENLDPGYADSPNIITVAATASSDTRASFSNYGNLIDISAPGVSVLSTSVGGGYSNVSGTSFASPITAAVAALVMDANPSLSLADIEYVLEESSVDLGTAGWDQYYGYGRVDAAAAVALALQTTNSDRQAPTVAIMSPANNSMVAGLVTITASASDNTGVTSVKFYVGSTLAGEDTSSPYSVVWDSKSVTDGNLIITAKAIDQAGNIATSAARTLIVSNNFVDNTAPQVAIISPSSGATVSGNVSISVSASDNYALASVTIAVDGTLLCSGTTSLGCTWSTRKASSGSHIITATASDTSGNVAQHQISVTLGSTSTKPGRSK